MNLLYFFLLWAYTYLMKVILETRRPFWYVWYQLTRTDDWTGAPKYEDFNLFTSEFGEVWGNPQALVARNDIFIFNKISLFLYYLISFPLF